MYDYAILTHHWVPNFGANLQVIATYNYLSKKGNTIVLNYINEKKKDRYSQICTKEQMAIHLDFVNAHVNLSPVLHNENDIIDFFKRNHIKTVISGSDAVFRLTKQSSSFGEEFPNPFWLKWTEKIDGYMPKRAFLSGSSTGTNFLSFDKVTKSTIKELLLESDYISVRDKWTKIMFMLMSFNKIKVDLSPDPVFILNDETSFDEKVPQSYDKYILVSIRPNRIDELWLRNLKEECNRRGYKLFSLPFPEYELNFENVDENINLPLSPGLWFNLIANASGVIGERFHLAVSSMVNNTPIYSIDHYRKTGLRGHFTFINIPMTSKVYSVMKEANLLGYCVHHPHIAKTTTKNILDRIERWPNEKVELFLEKQKKTFIDTIGKIVHS